MRHYPVLTIALAVLMLAAIAQGHRYVEKGHKNRNIIITIGYNNKV